MENLIELPNLKKRDRNKQRVTVNDTLPFLPGITKCYLNRSNLDVCFAHNVYFKSKKVVKCQNRPS